MNLNISASDLAKVLKLSKRWVNQLVKNGVLKREADGNFYLPAAVEAYYSFKFRSDEDLNYERDHALLEKAKRETAEIELEKLKGGLLLATDIRQLMATMILTCKSRLLSIPTKCASKVLGQKNLSVIADKLREEIYEALDELKQIPAENLGVDNADDVQVLQQPDSGILESPAPVDG